MIWRLPFASNPNQVLTSAKEFYDIGSHNQVIVDWLNSHHAEKILASDGELVEQPVSVCNYEYIAFTGIELFRFFTLYVTLWSETRI